MSDLTTVSEAFGWNEMHPGSCCDCCNGYCPQADWTPGGERVYRFQYGDREWVSDRYVSLDVALFRPDSIPESVTPSRIGVMATKAVGAATGLVGPATLAVLERLPMLGLADSDVEKMHALTFKGRMVGFANKASSGGLPAEALDRVRRMSASLDHSFAGESRLLVAAYVIERWLAQETDHA